MEKRSGIYCIENMINGKRYVGQGQDVAKRMGQGHRECRILYFALKKYGKENFKRYIILYCEVEELGYYETECIRIFHSHVSNGGYNIAWGGVSAMTGRNHSDESIEKMSKNHWDNSGENNPMFGKRGENNHNFGKHPSEETKKRMSDSHIGLQAGENHPMFGKIGENNPNFGKRRSDEAKKRMRDSSPHLSGENNPMFGKKRPNASSKYFGVNKIGKRWQIRACVNGKQVRIGYSKDEITAAKMYDKYIIENNLPNPLNFPENN